MKSKAKSRVVAEAEHGDLGIITPGDVLIAVSRSGDLDTLAAVVGAAQRLSVPVVVWTQAKESALAHAADLFVPVWPPARPGRRRRCRGRG